MDVPDPWDFEVFCKLLQERRGRPLEILPILPVRADFPNGLFLSFDTVDRIYMVKGTTSYHREHIALHEIGHLLLKHQGYGLDIKELASVLFPDLDPALVQRVLGRSGYSDPQEQQAEYFAGLVLARADERRSPRFVDDLNAVKAVGRLEAIWGPASRQGFS
ncbi:hypothetical protein [Actinocorallia libanotica]|uniref:hypothetical protein n=1 Tax=Actinocorallia libanotica TaxID=46162 RepID=UPI0031DD621D